MSKDFIDNFSSKSKEYSFSRPIYPDELFEFLSNMISNKDLAWDCATGNGQAAIGLCKYFKNVIASDASRNQIDNKLLLEVPNRKSVMTICSQFKKFLQLGAVFY